jgi:hypothetical protein
MPLKVCSVCGVQFGCGAVGEGEGCWCGDYPPIMPLESGQGCYCPACLKAIVREKIAEYLRTITPENAPHSLARNCAVRGPLVEGIDFYLDEGGLMVFTAWYLLKRGHCCRSGCRHCPYGYSAGRPLPSTESDPKN